MAAYMAASITLGALRIVEFTVSNWDLGIFQQALWTTAHGQLFYESGNWESSGDTSFLQVHPAPILYLVVPVYAAFPAPLTLTVVQSIVVAFAAVPLYRIGTVLLGDRRIAVGICILYLAWAPILTSSNYDFHLEAFIPTELLTLFWFWLSERYLLGFVAATAAFLTLEVTPFLVAALALYFLLDPGVRLRAKGASAPPATPPPPIIQRVRGALRGRAARYSLGLLAASAVAYAALRLFEWWLLPAFLGTPPHPPSGSGSLLGAATGAGLPFNLDVAAFWQKKLEYWVLLVGLLGFLPLCAPRALILVAPWFLFSLQSSQLYWSVLGYQYGFLPAAPLILAAVLGVEPFRRVVLPRLREMARSATRGRLDADRMRLRRPFRRVTPARAAGAMLAVLVVANLYLTPVNPLQQHLNSPLSGYRVSYQVAPGFTAVATAVALIPSGAPVLASDDLFPFVANSREAYSLYWTPQQPVYLPFNASALPEYVLLSSDQQFAVPPWLWPNLANETTYGVVASVWSTPVGTVYLWELHYRGAPIYEG